MVRYSDKLHRNHPRAKIIDPASVGVSNKIVYNKIYNFNSVFNHNLITIHKDSF